jgi:aspartokinase
MGAKKKKKKKKKSVVFVVSPMSGRQIPLGVTNEDRGLPETTL